MSVNTVTARDDLVDFVTANPFSNRWIGSEVLPMINCMNSNVQYSRVTVSDKDIDTEGTSKFDRASRTHLDYETPSVALKPYYHESAISAIDNQNLMQGNGLRASQNAAMDAQRVVMAQRERVIADLIFGSSNYNNTAAAAAKYDVSTSEPIKEILESMEAVPGDFAPNVAVLGRKGWVALRQHADIIRAINANDGGSGVASKESVAGIFGFDGVYVGLGQYSGYVSGTKSDIWGTSLALICKDISASEYYGGRNFAVCFEKRPMIHTYRDINEGGYDGSYVAKYTHEYSVNTIEGDLGYLLTAIV